MAKYNKAEGRLFVSPSVLVLILLTTFTLIYSLYISFLSIRTWNFARASFIFIGNYLAVFRDSIFLRAIAFTCVYAVVCVVVELVIGLILAYLLSEVTDRYRVTASVLSILVLLPLLIPQVATSMIFKLLLNDTMGLVPYLFRSLGLRTEFLSTQLSATVILVLVDVWQWTPFFFLILYAGMRIIPKEALEAAKMEGAGSIRILFSITLPLVSYMVTVSVMLRGIWLLKAFDAPRIVTGGGPGISTRTLTMQIDQYAFQEGSLGKAAAATFIVYILVNVIVWGYFRIIRRHESNGGL